MNAPTSWQDEHIHAFVDGELDPATAQRLEADSRTDAALAARIARQRQLTARLRARFDPVLGEAVPQRLKSPLEVVVPFGARSGRVEARGAGRPRWSLREWGAVAASLFLGVALATLYFQRGGDAPVEVDQGRLLARGALDEALTRQPSARADPGSSVQVLLSFRDSGGQWCRAFTWRTGSASTGLACRQAGRWQVQLLEGGNPGPATGDYRQAGSALPDGLRAAMEARGAAEPLGPEAETRLITRGWDPPRP